MYKKHCLHRIIQIIPIKNLKFTTTNCLLFIDYILGLEIIEKRFH